MRVLTILLLGLALSAPPALGWNATGHHLTADIAFGLLTAEQQRHVVRILKLHPRFDEDFAADMPAKIASGPAAAQATWIVRRASVWVDRVGHVDEAVRERYHRGPWHYVNLPVYLTERDAQLLDGTLGHNMSFEFEPPLGAELNVIQALRGNLLVWRDSGSSDADKAVALCWVLHLVGDLHQPLHSVALFSAEHFPLGDRGGNSIRIAQPDDTSNLHAVWDDLPDAFDAALPAAPAVGVVTLDAPADWLQRHARLASEYAYTPELRDALRAGLARDRDVVIDLSPAYRAAAVEIAREQVALAGYRIAALLQDEVSRP